METCSVVLTFESVDEILWCDRSNETALQQYFCMLPFVFSIFYKLNFDHCSALLGVEGLVKVYFAMLARR